jgi:FkbM family methyltransferase
MIELIGDEAYGGWRTETSNLTANSIVYSFGQGDNISWDLALIKKVGCKIYAFDPDPKSVKWLSTQTTPPQYIFRAEGISTYDGTQRFYHAFRADKVNSSTMRKNKTFDDLPVKRLRTLMRERGHDHIDILKLDIEGSEYGVLEDIIGLDIQQILVEIHQRFFTGWKGLKRLYGWIKTKHLLCKIKRAGFEVLHRHDIGDGSHDGDYLFIKRL